MNKASFDDELLHIGACLSLHTCLFIENTGVSCTGTFITLVYGTVPEETCCCLAIQPSIFQYQNYHSTIVSLPRYVLKFAGGCQDVPEPDAPRIRPSWKYLGNL